MIEAPAPGIAGMRPATRLQVLTWSAIAIYAASGAASVAFYGRFWTSGRMGDAVPWYFIGRSFLGGVSAAVAMVLIGALAVIVGRGLGKSVWGALMPAVLFLSLPLAQGVNVLLHTRRVWSPTTAVSGWHTADAFLRSDGIAMFVGLAVAATIAFALWRPWRRSRE